MKKIVAIFTDGSHGSLNGELLDEGDVFTITEEESYSLLPKHNVKILTVYNGQGGGD